MPKILEVINKFSEYFLEKIDPHMKLDHFLSTNHGMISYLFLLVAIVAISYIFVGKNVIFKIVAALLTLGLFLFSILSGYTSSLKLSESNYAMLENHALVVYVIIGILLISLLSFLKQKLNCTASCLVGVVFAIILVGTLIYTGISIR